MKTMSLLMTHTEFYFVPTQLRKDFLNGMREYAQSTGRMGSRSYFFLNELHRSPEKIVDKYAFAEKYLGGAINANNVHSIACKVNKSFKESFQKFPLKKLESLLEKDLLEKVLNKDFLLITTRNSDNHEPFVANIPLNYCDLRQPLQILHLNSSLPLPSLQ